MKLFPQDLRDRQHSQLVRARAHYSASTTTPLNPNAPLPEPQLGLLGKFWAKGLGMSDRQAAVGNAVASEWTQGTAWLTSLLGSLLPGMIVAITAKKTGLDPALAWAAFLSSSAAISAAGFGPLAQLAFRSLHKPIQAVELESLMKDSVDALEVAYLRLVRDAILISVPATAESDIRDAIMALGEAIDRLPLVTIEAIDLAGIRAEALALRETALGEPDRVTAESIERRADALERRARAHEHSALLARRAAALRAEIHAQIETLREGLAGHQLENGLAPTVAFSELSETARRVAQEAASTAGAKAEIEVVQARAL